MTKEDSHRTEAAVMVEDRGNSESAVITVTAGKTESMEISASAGEFRLNTGTDVRLRTMAEAILSRITDIFIHPTKSAVRTEIPRERREIRDSMADLSREENRVPDRSLKSL